MFAYQQAMQAQKLTVHKKQYIQAMQKINHQIRFLSHRSRFQTPLPRINQGFVAQESSRQITNTDKNSQL